MAEETSEQQAGGRRIAVLGEMLELGNEAAKAHWDVGRMAGEYDIDLVIAVGGDMAKQLAGELTGDPDRVPHPLRRRGDVVARDLRLSAVGTDERGEDLHDGGLAGAVRTEQREDGPFRDVQVDAVEDGLVAVRLAQADGGDGGPRRAATTTA